MKGFENGVGPWTRESKTHITEFRPLRPLLGPPAFGLFSKRESGGFSFLLTFHLCWADDRDKQLQKVKARTRRKILCISM